MLLAFGDSNKATGTSASTAFGLKNEATNSGASAFGGVNKASGTYSSAFGYQNEAKGSYSEAFLEHKIKLMEIIAKHLGTVMKQLVITVQLSVIKIKL